VLFGELSRLTRERRVDPDEHHRIRRILQV
jgi:hypothetical protein